MLISPIDGKILHLKELGFIEQMLFDEVLNPEEFYKTFAKFLETNHDLARKDFFNTEELERVDEFIRQYFSPRINESKIWILRAYVVGRFIAKADLTAQAFNIEAVSKLPKFVQDAAKKYGLTLEEAKAMQQAVEEGASLMSNTSANTIQTVRNAMTESMKRHGNGKSLLDELQTLIKIDLGELNRNWRMVATTEANSAFNNGYLANLRPDQQFVIGISMPDACDVCMTLINGKVYKVRATPPEDYSELNPESEKYKKLAKIWETEVWIGKNNYGRSSSRQKRLDPTKGNTKDNLRHKHHHEHSMPALPQHPECFKGDVEIYTEKGWQRFDELEKGISVATYNMSNSTLEFQKPYEYIQHLYEGKTIRFYGKNIDIEMTEAHNILTGVRSGTRDRKISSYRLIPANQLTGEVIIPISCNYDKTEKHYFSIGRHKIDEITFAKLLGYYLSEGSCKSKKHGWEVRISQLKQDNNYKIYSDLKKLDVHLRRDNNSIQFNDEDICRYLKQFGLQPVRYIPKEIKNMSKEGIAAFIDAYILGDGNVSKPKLKLRGQKKPSFMRSIYTSSKKLADDLAEVLLKSGHSVSYKLLKIKGKTQKFKNGDYVINHDVWAISVKNSKNVQKFNKEEKYFHGEVFCVSVPNSTILVRSNGKVLFIGNCHCRWFAINEEAQYVDEDGQVQLRVKDEDAWENWYNKNIKPLKQNKTA